MWIHTEPRAKHQMSSPVNPCLIAFETGSLIDPETSPGSSLNLPISGPSVGLRDPCSQVWLFKWVLGINWSRRAWLHNGLSQANFSFRFQNLGLHQDPSLVAVPEALWDIHQSLSFLPRLLALLSNMTIHLDFSARVGKVFIYLF